MKSPATPLFHSHTETSPHQELAAAVVRQAIADLRHEQHRESALHFLAGGLDLCWWCAVAGLEVDEVERRVRPFLLADVDGSP